MRSLPVELLEIIVQATSTQDKLVLCISSKLINELAVRSLYKQIDLAISPAKAVRCCRTLVSNKAAALAVRVIRIADVVRGSHYLRGYHRLIEKVLKFLPRVVELALKISTTLFTNLIDHCVLPNLLRFIVSPPSTASFVAFIRRHPQLQFLSYGGLEFNAHEFGNIDLPALIVYYGPANIIPNILAMAPVQKLVVTWNIDDPSSDDEARGDHDRIFSSLVYPSVKYLDVTTKDWNLKLVSAISKSFPLLQVIILRKVAVASGGVAIDNLYDSLRDALPAFQHLHSITLAQIHGRPNPISSSDLDKEFEVVMAWGNICSSIDKCALSSGVTWYRMSHVWFPQVEDSNHSILNDWRVRAMFSGKYTAMIEDTAWWLANPQLLEQFLQLEIPLRAIVETESESVVGSDGDSGGEEASENDSDPDDADADEDEESDGQ